ncbi:MAG: PASTA domain-containing protein, partial [Treponema sp.]|nr:PASTA domain-containing protein [Treponema sp.]
MGLFDIDLQAVEERMSSSVKGFIFLALGLVVFVGLIAAAVFFFNVRGAEQTMVPDVHGKELTAALLELQVKELYPRIQLRHTQTSADRGLILEQVPPPGTIVRAGRRIQLVVSQGAMLNTVENFIGRNVDDARMDIQMMLAAPALANGFASAHPVLSIREPLMYEFSSQPAGTILQQRPEPGTPLTGPAMLDFVVSRGLEHAMVRLPNLMGMSVEDSLEQIGRTGIDFEFSLRAAAVGETPGTVVAQTPPGDTFTSLSTRVAIMVAAPANVPANEVFGLFRHEMARNPHPLLIRLEGILPDGEQRRLLTVHYSGGPLSVPFRLPAGSEIVLFMLNREIHRET